MKKIFITGGSGLLGGALVKFFDDQYQTYYPPKEVMDLTNKEQVLNFFELSKPDIVIHSACLTDVDYCELNQEEAYGVNVVGTRNIIEACKKMNATLVYISTDFIFDGEKGNYNEEDITKPINYYGKTKFMAEIAVKNSGLRHLIARVSVLYGNYPNKKFVRFVIDKLGKGHEVTVVKDHYGSPTLVDDIAYAIHELLKKEKSGVYHVAGSEKLSRFQMALKIAEHFGFDDSLIKETSANSFKQPAQRPKDSSLSIEKLKMEGIIMSSFSDGIKKIKR